MTVQLNMPVISFLSDAVQRHAAKHAGLQPRTIFLHPAFMRRIQRELQPPAPAPVFTLWGVDIIYDSDADYPAMETVDGDVEFI